MAMENPACTQHGNQTYPNVYITIENIRVQIAGVHLCNRFIATILGAPIFELQNHVHNPKIASTKCNGFAWLLATNKSAFCSSIIFEPFKDRNAFCSGPFGVQNS
jgi:hypothetical protein